MTRVESSIDELLVDHAHCEKKAAATAINLVFRYDGPYPQLAAPLAALAAEELEHFQLLLRLLEQRGTAFHPVTPGPYAARLLAAARQDEPERAVDTLLCAALIEARSCERMTRLAEELADSALRDFYRSLLASEARHFTSYVDLARSLPAVDVERRLDELATHEAVVIAAVPKQARMHG